MAFGKGGLSSRQETQNSEPEVQYVSDNEVEANEFIDNTGAESTQQISQVKTKATDDKPLMQEVNFLSAGNRKNAGGSKVWVCKHCKVKFTSSYTRIHIHFFRAPPGKKAEIQRCTAQLQDREKYARLLNRVKEAEKVGVSRSLKNSIFSSNASKSKPNDSSKKKH